jgi:homocysteine S-methyltransferase
MTPREAEAYHAVQIASFAQTSADMVCALTLTTADEAVGIVRAAQAEGLPVAVSFTVETDGRLPDGTALGDAVEAVDAATDAGAAYFMVNCAHPEHIEPALVGGGAWLDRIAGLRANASRLSHAELDEAEELDAGDPEDLGAWYHDLRGHLRAVTVVGGCCGTDHRHVAAICQAWPV